MKKINFVIVFSMLCGFSDISFAANSPANQQVSAQRLAGVNVPFLTRAVRSTHHFDGGLNLSFTAQELTTRGGDCGYDALYTDRQSVYNAISSLYNTNWNRLTDDERNALRELIGNVSEEWRGGRNRLNYRNPGQDWQQLDQLLRSHVLGGTMLDATLGSLISYIRGENLRIFATGGFGGDIYRFNEDWPIRYMLNQGNGHWQALKPDNAEMVRLYDEFYNFWPMFLQP